MQSLSAPAQEVVMSPLLYTTIFAFIAIGACLLAIVLLAYVTVPLEDIAKAIREQANEIEQKERLMFEIESYLGCNA